MTTSTRAGYPHVAPSSGAIAVSPTPTITPTASPVPSPAVCVGPHPVASLVLNPAAPAGLGRSRWPRRCRARRSRHRTGGLADAPLGGLDVAPGYHAGSFAPIRRPCCPQQGPSVMPPAEIRPLLVHSQRQTAPPAKPHPLQVYSRRRPASPQAPSTPPLPQGCCACQAHHQQTQHDNSGQSRPLLSQHLQQHDDVPSTLHIPQRPRRP